MKKIAIISLAIWGLGFMALTNPSFAAPRAKVTICHVPPGNPENAHSITVGEPSLSAHRAHGDVDGDCSVTGVVSELDPCNLESNLDSCAQDGLYY